MGGKNILSGSVWMTWSGSVKKMMFCSGIRWSSSLSKGVGSIFNGVASISSGVDRIVCRSIRNDMTNPFLSVNDG